MKFNFNGTEYQAHSSWCNFFDVKRISQLKDIGGKIGTDFTPQADKVLRFTSVDLSKVKIVILGQDPYPQSGVATGRAFEVGDINSWDELKRNSSLVNILKLLHKNYTQSEEVSGISEIRKDIKSRKFPLLNPKQLFEHFEKQGVLLLNTALTCQIDNSGSHTNIWYDFSKDLLKFIADENKSAVWFLWGKDAQNFCPVTDKERRYESYHPRLFNKTEGFFLHENHFAKCDEITWVG